MKDGRRQVFKILKIECVEYLSYTVIFILAKTLNICAGLFGIRNGP